MYNDPLDDIVQRIAEQLLSEIGEETVVGCKSEDLRSRLLGLPNLNLLYGQRQMRKIRCEKIEKNLLTIPKDGFAYEPLKELLEFDMGLVQKTTEQIDSVIKQAEEIGVEMDANLHAIVQEVAPSILNEYMNKPRNCE